MITSIHGISHYLSNKNIPILPKCIYFFIRIFCSCVLPPTAKLVRNVAFPYQGLGVVIHRRAVIGNNVMILPGVTIGGRSELLDVPVIEDDVVIGSGAKVLGPVRIGRGAKIGANAVVLNNIPPYSVAVGIPARVVKTIASP